MQDEGLYALSASVVVAVLSSHISSFGKNSTGPETHPVLAESVLQSRMNLFYCVYTQTLAY